MTADRLFLYLDRMFATATKVARYAHGQSLETSRADEIRQDAVVANIKAIGECVANIMESFPEFVADHPEVAWKDIRNMRNRTVHQYFHLDVEFLWRTADQTIPVFLTQLDALRHWRAQGE